MSKREEIIKLYFLEGEIPADIAKKLDISKSAVTQVLQKDERYQREKMIRKEKNKIKHKKILKRL